VREALTGLKNRRHFDEALRDGWLQPAKPKYAPAAK
jgi:PleD family two-component response regulator